MSGDDVCCSVVFGTLVGVFVFSVMWSELQCITKFHDDIVLAAITASDVIPETVKKSINFYQLLRDQLPERNCFVMA